MSLRDEAAIPSACMGHAPATTRRAVTIASDAMRTQQGLHATENHYRAAARAAHASDARPDGTPAKTPMAMEASACLRRHLWPSNTGSDRSTIPATVGPSTSPGSVS